MDGLTARRVKNSSHAMVVSAAPLEPNILYQVLALRAAVYVGQGIIVWSVHKQELTAGVG